MPLEDYIWWVPLGHGDSAKRRKKQCDRCGGQHHWRDPNRAFAIQDGAHPREADVFRAHVQPQGASENFVSAQTLLANMQMGGDNLVHTIFQCVQEHSRLNISAEEVAGDRQPQGGEDRRAGEELGGDQVGQTRVQQGDFPERDHSRKDGSIDAANRRGGNAAHLHRDHQCSGRYAAGVRELAHGLPGNLQGASRERNGRACITSVWE